MKSWSSSSTPRIDADGYEGLATSFFGGGGSGFGRGVAGGAGTAATGGGGVEESRSGEQIRRRRRRSFCPAPREAEAPRREPTRRAVAAWAAATSTISRRPRCLRRTVAVPVPAPLPAGVVASDVSARHRRAHGFRLRAASSVTGRRRRRGRSRRLARRHREPRERSTRRPIVRPVRADSSLGARHGDVPRAAPLPRRGGRGAAASRLEQAARGIAQPSSASTAGSTEATARATTRPPSTSRPHWCSSSRNGGARES